MLKTKEELNSVHLSEDVRQIAEHLRLLDISFFQFVRVYKDGSITTLSNNDGWLELFLSQRLYAKGFFSTHVFNLADGSYLWQSVPRGEVCAIAKTSFHIDHGLTILKKFDNYANIYLFAADENDYHINNLYLNNQTLLHHFINYFDASIDKHLRKKNIKIITNNNLSSFCDTIDEIPSKNRELFVENITKKGYFYTHNGIDIKLTKRQHDCVDLLIKGFSSKVIASKLSLSPRTCEHYIDAVKSKFGCNSRSDLISLLDLIREF